jgi:hypothetical protein
MARIVIKVVRSHVSIKGHILFQVCTVLLRSGSSTSCLWASVVCDMCSMFRNRKGCQGGAGSKGVTCRGT